MKLLITGAFGFVGRNIIPKLSESFEIKTLDNYIKSDFCFDLSKEIPIINEDFEVVLHVAGLAHTIGKSDQDYYNVNFEGTKNLCKSLEKCHIRNFIFISSVAVYGLESGNEIKETQKPKPNTAYGISKLLAEDFLTNWALKNKITLTIFRPSLIAGPNPPGNLGEMINGINKYRYFSINGINPQKSILLVNDLANLVLLAINKGGVYNVCDSYPLTFKELELLISSQLNKHKPLSINYKILEYFVRVVHIIGIDKIAPINQMKLNKISQSLTFSNEKARKNLNWEPINVKDNFRIG